MFLRQSVNPLTYEAAAKEMLNVSFTNALAITLYTVSLNILSVKYVRIVMDLSPNKDDICVTKVASHALFC